MIRRSKVGGENICMKIVEKMLKGKNAGRRFAAGRLDQLAASGDFDCLSACRFSKKIMVLSAGRPPEQEAGARSADTDLRAVAARNQAQQRASPKERARRFRRALPEKNSAGRQGRPFGARPNNMNARTIAA